MVTGKIDVSKWFEEESGTSSSSTNIEAGDPAKAEQAAKEKEEKQREKEAKERRKQHKQSIAASILIAKGLQKMVQQSRIVSTTLGALGKALGLLMDLVLLPFLPLIVFGLLALYSAILAITSPLVKLSGGEGGIWDLLGLGDLVIGTLAGAIAGGLAVILLAAILGIDAGPIAIALGALLVAILAALLIGWAYTAGDAFGQFLKDVVYWAGYNFAGWLRSATELVISWASGAWETLKGWLGQVVDFIINGFTSIKDKVVEIFTTIYNAIYDGIKSVYDKITALIPKLDTSSVSNTVGNTVSAVTQSASNVFNFNGLQPEQLPDKVMSILRGMGSIFNL